MDRERERDRIAKKRKKIGFVIFRLKKIYILEKIKLSQLVLHLPYFFKRIRKRNTKVNIKKKILTTSSSPSSINVFINDEKKKVKQITVVEKEKERRRERRELRLPLGQSHHRLHFISSLSCCFSSFIWY